MEENNQEAAVSPKTNNKTMKRVRFEGELCQACENFEGTRASGVVAEVLGDGEEAEEGQVLRCPEEPSEEEVEKHLAMGHPSFRSWCPHCVRGGGQSQERRKKDGREDIIPKICVDYMTMSEQTVGQEENWVLFIVKRSGRTRVSINGEMT